MKKLWPSEVSENSKQLAGNSKIQTESAEAGWAGIFPPKQVDWGVDTSVDLPPPRSTIVSTWSGG